MNKGRLLTVIAGIILISVLVSAATNNTNATNASSAQSSGNTLALPKNIESTIEKAYICLDNNIGNRTTLSLQEAVFGTLALGEKKNLVDTISNQKKANEECWPKNGCTLKDTSQVMLAYERIGKDSDGIESWIASKNATPTELSWYLEMDISSHVPSECTITYDGAGKKINIGEDMKITGNAGACLTVSPSGYW